MIDRGELQSKIIAIVAEKLGVALDKVLPQAIFVDDLGADSLDGVEIIMAIEDEFELEIPDEEATKITCLRKAVDYAAEQLEKKDAK